MNAHRLPCLARRSCLLGATVFTILVHSSVARAQDAAPAAPTAQEAPSGEAKVRVRGLGFFQNRDLREMLAVLEPEGRPLPVLDTAFVEDAILVLQSAMGDRGYLKSSGEVRLVMEDGSKREYQWDAGTFPTLPRNIAAVEAEFRLEPGVLYHLESLDIDGLESLTEEQARGYFVGDSFLFSGKSARKYTPAGLERGSDSLRVQLERAGRADATVTVAEREIDDATGEVRARVQVDEGPLHRIAAVRIRGDVPQMVQGGVENRLQAAVGSAYSPLRRQDLLQRVNVHLYGQGYAEARVRLLDEDIVEREGEVHHTLIVEVETGPQIRVGEVGFSGDDRTRTSVLRRATEVRSGDIFDRNRIEEDRLRLSNLGVFSAVRAEVSAQQDDVWDLTYELRPSKRLEVGLLAGYGSYEKLRGGLEVFHANQLGRAERGRLQLIESTKSTSAEYQITVPQIFGTMTSTTLRAFGLDREEVSFDRREAGISAGLRRHFERWGIDAAARYQYESLRAVNVVPDLRDTAPEDSRVGAVSFDLTKDRRDNPLSPKSGYEFSLALETAAQAIGGEVDYQRLDLKASWHTRVGRGYALHLGLRHGAIWGFGDGSMEIPINRRFFPGGESTVRGYAEGTAAPRGVNGETIGAEVSTIANIEFEAALLANVSAVLFVDTGVTAASIDDYPGDQVRVSAGLGLRYNSLIGPVRLEYGHNIVRETGDQDGQIHFSLGFPF